MNTLSNGLVEALRLEAIQRAKGAPNANQEEMIELKEEFRDILNNPIFPLSTATLTKAEAPGSSPIWCDATHNHNFDNEFNAVRCSPPIIMLLQSLSQLL